MRVCVLGSVEVRDDVGSSIALTPQLRRLVALLAVADGAVVTTDRIAEHVAGGHVEGSAIRMAVSRLRRTLSHRIETAAMGYRMRLAADELDAEVFETLVARARTCSSPEEQVDQLRRALALWRGSAYDGLADESWAIAAATRLDEAQASAVEELAAALIAADRSAEAVTLLNGHIVEHPYRERPVALVMRALASEGRLTHALRAFQRLSTALRDEVGIEPSRELRALEAELLAAGDPELAGTRPPPTPTLGNFRLPLSSFVGRVREVKEVADAIDARRLVTLTGVGGAGKTRLAVEVAAGISERQPGGIWMVELAPVAQPELVAHAVGAVFGVGAEAGVAPVEAIVDLLRDRRALLILDNCEHVRAAAAKLAVAIISDCPGVRIVATSREPLEVPGEQIHAVLPLNVEEGFELFCQRARHADDRFAWVGADRPVIEAVCARLDGLPLAIELAAARTRWMTPTDVLASLDGRFRLLRIGSTASGRHATLHNAIDWSYRLLADREQLVLDRAAVFSGGFDLDAAVRVCGFDGVDPLDVAASIGSLVDKSMIVADRLGRHARFMMLETVRQFAHEHLVERGELVPTRDAHAAHFSTVASGLAPIIFGSDQPGGIAMLEREWDNFREAIASELELGDAGAAAAIAAALASALMLGRDEHGEWVAAIQAALPDDHPLSGLMYALAGWWANLRGDHTTAMRLATAGLALGQQSRQTTVALRTVIGEALSHAGDPSATLAAVREALAVEVDDRHLVNALVLACWAAWGCEPPLVAGFAARLDAVARVSGLPSDRYHAAYTAGIVDMIEGDPTSALAKFREAAQWAQGLKALEGEALQGIALAAATGGDPGAATCFVAALDSLAGSRGWAGLWLVMEAVAIHWVAVDRLDLAAPLLGYLDANSRASVFLVAGRRQANDRVRTDPSLERAIAEGAALDRGRIIAYVRDQLDARGAHLADATG